VAKALSRFDAYRRSGTSDEDRRVNETIGS
jgi:hypothetical protein